MRITNEKYEVAFMSCAMQEAQKLIQEYGFEYEGTGSDFLVIKTESKNKVEQLVDDLRNSLNKDCDDQYTIGVSNEYDVVFDEEDDAYEYIQTMFRPNFKCEDFCVSRVSFYSEIENDVYMIEMDYGFEEGIEVKARRFIENEKLEFVFAAFDQLKREMFQEVER